MSLASLIAKRNSPLLLAAVVASGLFFAGCDEHVDVVRDHSVAIPKHATWAWRPAPPPEKNQDRTGPDRNGAERNGDRPVISRDVIADDGRRESGSRLDNETFRLAIRTDIEQTLRSKGFNQVDDPAAADFLVDYHVGIRRRTMTVERPAFVCGPFGCYESYRWGYWGGPGYAYQNVHYREGTIVFDFAKQGSNKVAFRAVGMKVMYRDSFTTDHIRDAVHRLLRDLKPGKS